LSVACGPFRRNVQSSFFSCIMRTPFSRIQPHFSVLIEKVWKKFRTIPEKSTVFVAQGCLGSQRESTSTSVNLVRERVWFGGLHLNGPAPVPNRLPGRSGGGGVAKPFIGGKFVRQKCIASPQRTHQKNSRTRPEPALRPVARHGR